jgi:hypothetical protein
MSQGVPEAGIACFAVRPRADTLNRVVVLEAHGAGIALDVHIAPADVGALIDALRAALHQVCDDKLHEQRYAEYRRSFPPPPRSL